MTNIAHTTPLNEHSGSRRSRHGDGDMDPIDKELRVRDHRAALEAEAGIERLLRDLRELRASDDGVAASRPRRVRSALGRALIAAGSAIAATPATDEPCPDGAEGFPA
ncbi:MAG: hypothetical protein ACJ77B_12315 [Chloroflexota bacterium]